MTTIVTRTGKGSALTTAEMDANLNNLNNDKLENVVEDTTPQLGGNLDVGTNSILTTDASNIVIIDDNLRVTGGNISVDVADTNMNISPGSGTGTVNIQGSNGLQITGDATDAIVFTSSTNSNLKIKANGTGKIVFDSNAQMSNELDVNDQAIVNNQTSGNIALTTNGAGKVVITAAAGLDVSSGYFTASGTNANATISANGSGYILLNQAGGVIVTDTAASGYGVITGATSKGLSLLSNAGAQGVNDPQLGLANGGGISISPGATSTTTFNGTNVSNMQLKDYKETVYTGGSTTGTITPDVANGNVQSITLTGNITFNAFANAEAGQSMTLIVKQSATGGETLTSTMKFAGGTKTLSTGANAIDIISVFYDGTTYYASLATNFS